MSPSSNDTESVEPPICSSRPSYLRSNSTSAIYHPAQIARAKLGNTCGAVYLSPEETQCSHSIHRPRHRVHSSHPNLESLAKVEQKQAVPNGKSLGRSGNNNNPERPSLQESLAHLEAHTYPGMFQSLCQPVKLSRSSIRSQTALPASSQKLPYQDEDPKRILHETLKLKHNDDLRNSSPSNGDRASLTWSPKQANSHQPGPIANTDGSSDCLLSDERTILREASSDAGLIDPISQILRVRFASSDDLLPQDDQDSRNSRYSAPFLDPFQAIRTPITRHATDFSDISAYVRPDAFSGHRDTLARVDLRTKNHQNQCSHIDEFATSETDTGSESSAEAVKMGCASCRDASMRSHTSHNQIECLPLNIVNCVLQHVSFKDYKSLRLVCRKLMGRLPLPKLPAVLLLPNEIFHQIYSLLQPSDFDAARHTCKSWFLASIDQRLGHLMSKKAGCFTAFLSDMDCLQRRLQAGLLHPYSRTHVNDTTASTIDSQVVQNEINQHKEWMLFKRLTTTCQLSANWRGSGLQPISDHTMSRLTVVQVIDFRALSRNASTRKSGLPRFRMSTCSKFLLVVANLDVFIYGFEGSGRSLHPLARLVAPARILEVSMDTSSQRFAVAALLEGCVGALWELQDILGTPTAELSSLMMKDEAQMDTYDSSLCCNSSAMSVSSSDGSRMVACGSLRDCESDHESHIVCKEDCRSVASEFLPFCTSPAEQSTNTSTDLELESEPLFAPHFPIKPTPTTLYKNLGTLSDSPRSVSICPQRKCVAFGCRTGVELHWIDPLTGDNISRWLSLNVASDHLYFLPRRSGTSSGNKLRLISSAAGLPRQKLDRHNSTPTTLRFRTTGSSNGRARSMTRLFFGSLPIPSLAVSQPVNDNPIAEEADGQGILRVVDCDHFCAKPLSDGSHMLFTDPVTGLLCLGSNAPLGGPTKLVRKACMIPPDYIGMPQRSLTCYTAGQDLRWGVRVVGVYDDGSIILYDIPSDCFQRIRNVRSSPDVWDELSGVLGQSDLMMDVFMLSHTNTGGINPDSTNFDEYFAGDQPVDGSAISFRSLQIDGSLICRTKIDVQDLAIDCTNGGLVLWIFATDGSATSMDIYVPRNHTIRYQKIGADGLLYETTSGCEADLVHAVV